MGYVILNFKFSTWSFISFRRYSELLLKLLNKSGKEFHERLKDHFMLCLFNAALFDAKLS